MVSMINHKDGYVSFWNFQVYILNLNLKEKNENQ